MRRCKQCLLPEAAPDADLDGQGTCGFCRSYGADRQQQNDAARLLYEADLERTLRSSKGDAQYDVLMCLSGGKDSILLLHRLVVEYKLNVLAFTVDVNIPDIAWANIRKTIAKLGCDHLVYRPPDAFYRKLFRHLLQNQEERGAVYTVSYVYAPLFEGAALAAAMEKNIPLVLAGYSPGQPDPERMVYEFSRHLICETDWNPARYPAGTRFPRYLAPFHAWPYDQEQAMRQVFDLGLVSRRAHASPVHSNYPINWLLMYSDLKHFGFNPYAPEFAALIREGKAKLQQWKFMAPLIDFMIRHKVFLGHTTARQMQWLGLTDGDLCINRPRGAYDPVLGE